MDRRSFIVAFSTAAALLGTLPAQAECGEPSAVEFVEALYQKQVRLQAQNTPLGRDDFLPLFSRGMRSLMQAPRRLNKNVTLGPVLNAFFGWGVLPGTEVNVGTLKLVSGQHEGPATVGVPIAYHGETHELLVHVLLQTDGWRIANIVYDNGRSLLDHYRQIATQ